MANEPKTPARPPAQPPVVASTVAAGAISTETAPAEAAPATPVVVEQTTQTGENGTITQVIG